MSQILTHANDLIQTFLKKRHLSPQTFDALQRPYSYPLHDPELLPYAQDYITALHRLRHKNIAIIPDYDTDGIASGTLLHVALSLLDFTGKRYLYAPTTQTGYGMTQASVEQVLEHQRDTEVILTTDNGVVAYEGIHYAHILGIEVLVSDHHLGKPQPTEATVCVDPNQYQPNPYPFKDICGTVVIWKLMLLYAKQYSTPEVYRLINQLVVLAGIATISDVMPLLNENRTIVNGALAFLQGTHHLQEGVTPEYTACVQGLTSLMTALERNGNLKYGIDEDTIGFYIAPILNTPRRILGSSELGFALFDPQRLAGETLTTSEVAEKLVTLNALRKTEVNTVTQRLETTFADSTSVQSGICVCVNAKGGYAGLIAGRLMNQFHVPTLVFACDLPTRSDILIDPETLPPDTIIGASGRAPKGFHLYKIFNAIHDAHPEFCPTGGGHAQAIGLSVRSQHWSAFVNAFHEQVAGQIAAHSKQADQAKPLVRPKDLVIQLGSAVPVSDMPVDFVVNSSDGLAALKEAVERLNRLKPFGHDFPKPTFTIVTTIKPTTIRYMGQSSDHTKVELAEGFSLLQWRSAKQWQSHVTTPERFTIIGNGCLSINRFRHQENLQLILDEWSPLSPEKDVSY